ncbi:hypothetical protein [Paracoccus contaminans]|uniref:hypothetical protein n=1 Tax=Paracoccus contaminans TaxID=1945662 RepID=UPI001F0A7EA6|nr:hypothetical protein [Paracoccus contaminans]
MPMLRVHLNRQMLPAARAGRFPFMALLARTLGARGWDVAFEPAGPAAHDNPPPPAITPFST